MKKSLYIAVFAIIAILVLAAVLRQPTRPATAEPAPGPAAAESQRQPLVAAAEKTTATRYYLTADKRYLLPVSSDITATTEVARMALEQLLAGPPNEKLLDSVPVDAKLLDIYTIYQTVYVDLSAEFTAIDAADMPQAVAAIAATVLPLADGYQLQLLINGEGREQLAGVELGQPLCCPALNPDSSLLPEGTDPADASSVLWYMPDESSGWLIPRTLYYLPEQDEPLELLARRCLPSGLTLNTAYWSDEQISLDISFDPQAAYRCGEAAERLWVEALARSMCALDDVGQVRLTIDGQPASVLPKGTDISQPLTVTAPINYLPAS